MTRPLEIVTEVPDENSVKRAVIQFLLYKGYFVLRINSGAAAGEYEDKQGQVKKRFMRFVQWHARGVTFKEGQAGTSDLLAIKEGHPPLAIETKRLGNTPSDAQRRFMAEWESYGGRAIVAYSVTDVEKALNQ